MKVRVVRNTVIDGSVRWAGEEVDLSRSAVPSLEADGLVERVREEDYEDGMEVRYGAERATHASPIQDVMVFTPVLRLEPETRQAIFSLEWEHAITWVFQRDNPVEIQGDMNRSGEARKAGIMNHLHQFERGRETFLKGNYDALLIVESDIIPPRDALVRLAAVLVGRATHASPLHVPVHVAYGVYTFRSSEVVNVFELYPSKNGVMPRNPGESLSVHPHLLKRAVKLGVYPCSGAGFGCTLIRREVVEAIPFRLESNVSVHCDTFWIRDVMKAGFRSAADFGVVCGHKDETGEVLWPELPKRDPQIYTD